MKREQFKSRFGFLMTAAGCAIGLGNVWRFPYLVGQYGGALFVLIYLFCVFMIGLPILTMELAVGRASERGIVLAPEVLCPQHMGWKYSRPLFFLGNYVFMMSYTVIASWIVFYILKSVSGQMNSGSVEASQQQFEQMLAHPKAMVIITYAIIIVSFLICNSAIKNGIEKWNKIMLSGLFVIMLILAIYNFNLPNVAEGIRFYLKPSFDEIQDTGILSVFSIALGQAFYSIGCGLGTMSVMGSYLKKDRTLTSEAAWIVGFDTSAAILAGFMVVPACFSYSVNVTSGPELLFVVMPMVFHQMPLGRCIEVFFFIAMLFAAVSTITGAFESMVANFMDMLNCSRKKAVAINLPLMLGLSLPCIFGYNIWSGVQPFGEGSTILDLVDFIVSNNILLIGAVLILIFSVSKKGFGWENFLREANVGKGLEFPKWSYYVLKYINPFLIIWLFIIGYIEKFT